MHFSNRERTISRSAAEDQPADQCSCAAQHEQQAGATSRVQEPTAGLINKPWGTDFLYALTIDPGKLCHKPHIDYLRQAGSKAIELVM
ncbi:protocatechuate 4,5-dioxygenase subunit beta [Sphingomonas sp. PAMC 26617]|uniref:protocatechuate 4,5-dioxygenase subunit beta n=1 Tax=Sphingomonas sp. PAMC 26617 TaxID=1112216 RepID=UPI0002885650|nr:protocatechuate 4,5-dioxygenase subunit beta [Sphingomonas sp. PAMC 26617]